jgi:type IV fimbrial biogenesis protein FimT
VLNRAQRGIGLIEMMIGVTIVGILMSVGVSNFSQWIQNARIRTAADSLQAGLQRARAEALKRNAQVRFQLTSSTTASCALSATSLNWIVSLDSVAGKCATAPSETVDPRIVEVRPAAEGTASVSVLADRSAIVFNGLGRVTPTPAGPISIDVRSAQGTCVDAGGTRRCLRLVVSAAGQVRACDPAVDSGNLRAC